MILDESFLEEPCEIFLRMDWSLQDIYIILKNQLPTIRITKEQLRSIAYRIEKQFHEQCTEEGLNIIQMLLQDIIKEISID